jgi:hypothetical protein
MIAEAIQKIQDIVQPRIIKDGPFSYATEVLEKLSSPQPLPEPFPMSSLSGLVDYVKSAFDHVDGYALFVDGPTSVRLASKLLGEFRQRETLAIAKPFLSRQIGHGQYMDLEQFIVGIQSGFVQDEMTAAVLRVVGNVVEETVSTSEDDGITQTVAARAGIARRAEAKVPNPVVLRPFRTFPEIEQPASRFVLRLRRKEGELPQAALFACDDCQWMVDATRSIGEYLKDADVGIPVFA